VPALAAAFSRPPGRDDRPRRDLGDQQPRPGDLVVNVCRAKQLPNMRASNSEISIRLTPPIILSLEQALDFLADDELLEVTPKNYRLRKRFWVLHLGQVQSTLRHV